MGNELKQLGQTLYINSSRDLPSDSTTAPAPVTKTTAFTWYDILIYVLSFLIIVAICILTYFYYFRRPYYVNRTTATYPYNPDGIIRPYSPVFPVMPEVVIVEGGNGGGGHHHHHHHNHNN